MLIWTPMALTANSQFKIMNRVLFILDFVASLFCFVFLTFWIISWQEYCKDQYKVFTDLAREDRQTAATGWSWISSGLASKIQIQIHKYWVRPDCSVGEGWYWVGSTLPSQKSRCRLQAFVPPPGYQSPHPHPPQSEATISSRLKLSR